MNEDYEEYLDAIIQYRKNHPDKKESRFLAYLKQHWPAILASLCFGALMTIALKLVINNWDYIKTTF